MMISCPVVVTEIPRNVVDVTPLPLAWAHACVEWQIGCDWYVDSNTPGGNDESPSILTLVELGTWTEIIFQFTSPLLYFLEIMIVKMFFYVLYILWLLSRLWVVIYKMFGFILITINFNNNNFIFEY